MSKLDKALLGIASLFISVALIGAWHEQRQCSMKGGLRLTTIMGESKCYDAKSLRPI